MLHKKGVKCPKVILIKKKRATKAPKKRATKAA